MTARANDSVEKIPCFLPVCAKETEPEPTSLQLSRDVIREGNQLSIESKFPGPTGEPEDWTLIQSAVFPWLGAA